MTRFTERSDLVALLAAGVRDALDDDLFTRVSSVAPGKEMQNAAIIYLNLVRF